MAEKGGLCGARFCKFLLIVINIACMLGGLVLIAAGIAVKVLLDNGNASEVIQAGGGSCDFVSGVNTEGVANCFAYLCLKVGTTTCSALQSFPIAFIVLGVFIFLLAFLGCCGAMKNNTFCLVLYFLLLLIIFLGQFAIAIAGFVYTDDLLLLMNGTWSALSQSQQREVMKVFDCCGFLEASTAQRAYCNSVNITATLTCLNAAKAIINSQIYIIAGVGIAIVLIEIVGLIGSCCVRKLNRS